MKKNLQLHLSSKRLRFKIYRFVLKELQQQLTLRTKNAYGYCFFIYNYLLQTVDESTMLKCSDVPILHFPELMAYRPEYHQPGQFWFELSEEGIQHRITILQTIMKGKNK